VEYFTRRKAREIGLHFIPRLIPGTMERLVGYDWPGNVRELSNAIERAIIIHGAKPVTFEDIVGIPGGKDETESPRPVPGGEEETLTGQEVRHIRNVLERTGGKIEGPGGAAAILGIHPATLRSRMRKLGIPFGRAAGIKPSGRDGLTGNQGRKHEREG
jgi:DNA-binding NtrC family response regulator